MSRLKREGNPPSGQLASPVPQAWDPSINDFREITGQNLGGGRFGADGVQWGKTASGLFVPVRVTNDGVQEVQLSGTIVELFRRTGLVLTAGSRIKLNPEPIDVSAFRGWQIGAYHADQYSWERRRLWYTGVFYWSYTNSGFYEVDPMTFRDISPVYPCLGDKMTWWVSSDGSVDTPSFEVRVWGVK